MSELQKRIVDTVVLGTGNPKAGGFKNELKVEVASVGDVMVFGLEGLLALNAKELDNLIRSHKSQKVVLDLDGVAFMDNETAWRFIDLNRFMEENGGAAVFVISSMDKGVGKYMTNYSLDSCLTIESTLGGAVERCEQKVMDAKSAKKPFLEADIKQAEVKSTIKFSGSLVRGTQQELRKSVLGEIERLEKLGPGRIVISMEKCGRIDAEAFAGAMRELKLHAARKRMDLFLVNVPERIREIFEKISFDISLEEVPSRRTLLPFKPMLQQPQTPNSLKTESKGTLKN